MKQRRILLGITTFLIAVAYAPSIHAQEFNSRSIATYTAEQAERGKAVYAKSCASCHGESLGGSEFASALNGMTFSRNWGGKSAVELFTYINTKMPPASPGQLGPEAAAQIIAYVLQVNGIQAGQSALPTDTTALALMQIPRGRTQRAGMMMPLSPLAPPMTPVVLPNPLEKFTPVTDELLQNPPPGDWLLWRRTYDDQGFSPLKEITKKNVHDLRVKWAWSLPNGENEGTPLEHDGVLFIESYEDKVQALEWDPLESTCRHASLSIL